MFFLSSCLQVIVNLYFLYCLKAVTFNSVSEIMSNDTWNFLSFVDAQIRSRVYNCLWSKFPALMLRGPFQVNLNWLSGGAGFVWSKRRQDAQTSHSCWQGDSNTKPWRKKFSAIICCFCRNNNSWFKECNISSWWLEFMWHCQYVIFETSH